MNTIYQKQTQNQTNQALSFPHEIKAAYFILTSTMTLKKQPCLEYAKYTHNAQVKLTVLSLNNLSEKWTVNNEWSNTKNPNSEFFQMKLKQFPPTIFHKCEEDFIATLSRPKDLPDVFTDLP